MTRLHRTRTNPRRTRKSPILTAALALLLASSGCRHSDLAEPRAAFRGRLIAQTVDAARQSERSRPPRLERMLDRFGPQAERDVELTRRNIDEVNSYWQKDLERWNRRQPIYRDELHRVLFRTSEQFDRTAVLLFY